MENELQKAIKASKKFLKIKKYKVVASYTDQRYWFDLVCAVKNNYVFVNVNYAEGKFPKEQNISSKKLDADVSSWLKVNTNNFQNSSMSVRYDNLDICIIGNQAGIRHHINAISDINDFDKKIVNQKDEHEKEFLNMLKSEIKKNDNKDLTHNQIKELNKKIKEKNLNHFFPIVKPKPPKPVRGKVTGKNRVENKTNNSTRSEKIQKNTGHKR